MRDTSIDHSDTLPSAAGGITRLACTRAKETGIELDSLLRKASLTRQQIGFWMTALVRICRQLTGRRLSTTRVSLMHRRGNVTPELGAFFGSDVIFGAESDKVAFASSTRDLAVVSADSYLHELLVKY